jgi:membrane-bound serine protease (ClpP class)
MKRLALPVLLPAILLLTSVAVAAEPVVRLVEFEAAITPISAKRILRAIDDAEAAGDSLVLIELDTPGGLVASMEEIVKRELSARVPIVVWVGPAGAKAASAGFFLLVSADVAAMAPGTRTGAASTVYGVGGENKEGDVMLKKSNEDLAALIRSIADHRGRNPEACEEAVFAAKAYEEQVALDKGLVDVIAATREELLQKLDGREIERFDGSRVVLETADARFVESEFGFRHGFMELLASPAVASILLLIGMLAIYVEFTNPGAILPGVVGALCLLLFALSAQVLPISAIGVLLIVLAAVMFLLEVKIASYGLLTLGGTVSLVIGSMMLIDGPIPELRVPAIVVLPTSLLVAVLCAVAMRLAIRAHRTKVSTGVEGLAGEIGRVIHALSPEGKVFVRGEIWNAASVTGPIPEGARVRVVRVDDMLLTVEAAEGPSTQE